MLTAGQSDEQYRLQLRDASQPSEMLHEVSVTAGQVITVAGTVNAERLAIDLSNIYQVDGSGEVTSRLPAK